MDTNIHQCFVFTIGAGTAWAVRQAVVFGPRLTVLAAPGMAEASSALGRKRHDAVALLPMAIGIRCNAAGAPKTN